MRFYNLFRFKLSAFGLHKAKLYDIIWLKIRKSLSAVLPITGIVLMISIFLIPMELGSVVMFLTGAVMLIVGMGFFQLGAEMAMTPNGANNLILRIPARRFSCRYLKKGLRFWVLFARIESIKGSSLPTEFGSLLRQDSYNR